jgi:acyl dehydratase
MSSIVLAERTFSAADQEWFAAVTGDRNPMHMDALVARRTMAGYPVVHGVHTLLWTLDSLFHALPDLGGVGSIKVSFENMIYIGECIRAVLVHRDPTGVRVEAATEGATIMSLEMKFAEPVMAGTAPAEEPAHFPTKPVELTFEQMAACAGQIRFPASHSELMVQFPAACRVLGLPRVSALAGSSFLVGMVCPGLHSIYRGLTFTAVREDAATAERLSFRVSYSDEDYRLIRLAVLGAGWKGQIDTNARPEPAGQASMAVIAEKVAPDAFAGESALVVGGSRGLGELTAKILAAGGAHVTVTYASGEAEARQLQAEIAAAGGQCDVMRYDVREDAGAQLGALARVPGALYYMATPKIFQRTSGGFSAPRLHEFLMFYVTGFSALCSALRAVAGPELAIYYPSSVAIGERPANITEYTMAKAAGEILCADMHSFDKWRKIVVSRLPRLPTDQTATLFEDDEGEDPVETMLAIVRKMQAGTN